MAVVSCCSHVGGGGAMILLLGLHWTNSSEAGSTRAPRRAPKVGEKRVVNTTFFALIWIPFSNVVVVAPEGVKQSARIKPVYRIAFGVRIPVPGSRVARTSAGLVRVGGHKPSIRTRVESLVGVIEAN